MTKLLDLEREGVLSEYLGWDNSIWLTLLFRLYARLYPNHIAENFVAGAREDLFTITAEDLLDFYKYYTPNNATIAVVGNFDKENHCLSC